MIIYGFDTETSLMEYNRVTELFQWVLVGEEIDYIGSTTEEFKKLIQSIYNTMKKDVVIVALNLSFDYYMTLLFNGIKIHNRGARKIRTLNSPSFAYFGKQVKIYRHIETNEEFEYKKDITGNKGNWRVKDRSIRLYFVDLSNYFLGKPRLVDIAKSFGVAGKTDVESMYTFNLIHFLFDHFTDGIDLYIKAYMHMAVYCRQDSFIVKEVLEEIYADNPIDMSNDFRVTINSLGYHILKKMSGWKNFTREWYVKELEVDSMKGGRSGFNPKYLKKPTRGYYYDVHSMYSSVEYDMKVPISHMSWLTMTKGDYTEDNQMKIIKAIHESEDRTCIVKASVTLLKDVLPYYAEDKSLSFSSKNEKGKPKMLIGSWSDEEFYPAYKDGEIIVHKVSVISVYECKRGLFNSFIDFYFNQKLNSEEHTPKYTKAKLILNGAGYGKFVQKMRSEVSPQEISGYGIDTIEDMVNIHFVGVPNHLKFGSVDLITKEGDMYTVEVQGEDIFISKILKKESWGACTIVGVMITSMSRRKMWTQLLRDNDPVVWDTDGGVITNRMDERLLHPTKLGMWALERCNNETDDCTYTTYAKKDYHCLHEKKIRMKGVPKIDITGKKVITLESMPVGKWGFTGVIKPKEAKKAGKIPYSLEKREKKRKG